jgi:RNA polymerase sigma-70 factor (ECF subfamily)
MHANPPSDQARFMALLDPIQDVLKGYCQQLIWFPGDREDVLQSALTAAYGAFDRYKNGTNFRAWMFKHVQNSAWNHNRLRRNPSLSDPDVLKQVVDGSAYVPVNYDPAYQGLLEDSKPIYDFFDDYVHQALLELSASERTVLLLRSVGEFNHREISETLEMSMGTVCAQLHRSRELMGWRLTAYVRQMGWKISQHDWKL